MILSSTLPATPRQVSFARKSMTWHAEWDEDVAGQFDACFEGAQRGGMPSV